MLKSTFLNSKDLTQKRIMGKFIFEQTTLKRFTNLCWPKIPTFTQQDVYKLNLGGKKNLQCLTQTTICLRLDRVFNAPTTTTATRVLRKCGCTEVQSAAVISR